MMQLEKTLFRTASSALIILVLAGGCATNGANSQLENTVYSTYQKVNKLEGNLGESVNRLNQTTAEMTSRLDSTEQQDREITGMLQETNNRLAKMEENIKSLSRVVYEEFGRTVPSGMSSSRSGAESGFRMSPPQVSEGQQQSGSATSAQRTPIPGLEEEGAALLGEAEDDNLFQSPPPENADTQDGGNPELDYRNAKEAYDNKNYEQALRQFEQFLSRYPAHHHAKRALLWKGTSELYLEQYEDAVQTYDEFQNEYRNDSELMPYVLYNQGMAYLNLRRMDDAVDMFETVVSRFPNTQASEQARQNLSKMNQ